MPDSQTLLIVGAAMVAAILCFRLYAILGRRTGHEPPMPAAIALASQDTAAPQAPTSGGLLDIQMADRSFDTPKFLAGARTAYADIVTAFARGDAAALKPLLSPDVMSAFAAAIAARGDAPVASFVKLDDAHIAGAQLHGREAEITMSFAAEFAGEAGRQNITDVWTFARNLDSADPNWTLVATSGDLPE